MLPPPSLPPEHENPAFSRPQIIGIVLAVGGNLIISVALAVTKYSHNLNQMSEQPQPYVKLPLWWCGFAATLLGEAGNFAAYGFAGLPKHTRARALTSGHHARCCSAADFAHRCFTHRTARCCFGTRQRLHCCRCAWRGLAHARPHRVRHCGISAVALRCTDSFALDSLARASCALCVAGGCVVVLTAPEHAEGLDPDAFLQSVQATPFVVYIILLSATVCLMLSFRDS